MAAAGDHFRFFFPTLLFKLRSYFTVLFSISQFLFISVLFSVSVYCMNVWLPCLFTASKKQSGSRNLSCFLSAAVILWGTIRPHISVWDNVGPDLTSSLNHTEPLCSQPEVSGLSDSTNWRLSFAAPSPKLGGLEGCVPRTPDLHHADPQHALPADVESRLSSDLTAALIDCPAALLRIHVIGTEGQKLRATSPPLSPLCAHPPVDQHKSHCLGLLVRTSAGRIFLKLVYFVKSHKFFLACPTRAAGSFCSRCGRWVSYCVFMADLGD